MVFSILSFPFSLFENAASKFLFQTKEACPTAGKPFLIISELPYGGINHIRFKGWIKILSAYLHPQPSIQLTIAFYHNSGKC